MRSHTFHGKCRRTAAVLSVFVAALICFGSGTARAGKKEWMISLLPHYSVIRAYKRTRHGGGLAFSSEYGLADSWHLKAAVSYAAHAVTGDDPGVLSLGMLSVTVVYLIDIVRVVPSIHLGVDAAILGGKSTDTEVEAGFHAGLGVDYLLDRYWSIGIESTYHLFVPDVKDIPAYVRVGFRFSRRFF